VGTNEGSWFPKSKQKDLSDEKYLGITVGREWNIAANEEVAVVPRTVNEEF
jgi:nucleobase:cation symporter-1, NCS1 family